MRNNRSEILWNQIIKYHILESYFVGFIESDPPDEVTPSDVEHLQRELTEYPDSTKWTIERGVKVSTVRLPTYSLAPDL